MRHHRLVLALCTSLLASVTSAAAAPKARHHRVVRPQRAANASPSVIAERDAYRDAAADDDDELAAPARVRVHVGVIADPAIVFGGSDALAGARVFVRPLRRVALCGAADVGVFGASSRTWSASLDANVRITSRFLLSLGWRTLTLERALADMTMHGPRATFQVLV